MRLAAVIATFEPIILFDVNLMPILIEAMPFS